MSVRTISQRRRSDRRKALLASFDFGTGALDAKLRDPVTLGVEDEVEVPYNTLVPDWQLGKPVEELTSLTYQCPGDWPQALGIAGEHFRSKRIFDRCDVVASALSFHMHCLNLILGHLFGSPAAKMWNHHGAREFAKTLSEKLGWHVDGRMTIAQFGKLLEEHPAYVKRWVRFMTTGGGLMGSLLMGGGRPKLSPCEFAGLAVQNPHTGELAAALPEILGWEGLFDVLPECVPLGAILGSWNDTAKDLLGNPETEMIVLAAILGDQGAGRLGLFGADTGVGIVAGKSTLCTTVTESRPEDPTGTVDWLLDSFGRMMNMALAFNGMDVADREVTRQMEKVGRDFDGTRDRLDERAAEIGPDCNGIFGADFALAEPGIGLDSAVQTAVPDDADGGAVWRLRLTQIAWTIAKRVATVCPAGSKPPYILMGGGGANNPLLRQILADLTEIPVVKPEEAGSASELGAARCAALGEEVQYGNAYVDPLAFMAEISGEPKGDWKRPADEATRRQYDRIVAQFEKLTQA